MKRLLLYTILFSSISACKQTTSPKETAQAYVKAVYTADLPTAETLSSKDTKAVLDKAKKQTKAEGSPETLFDLATLTESTSENKAEVKNEVISLSLVNENGEWKVVSNENLLNEIQGRDEKLTMAKTKWDDLQKEYSGRLQVLTEYVKYKMGLGALSANVQKLNEAVNSISAPKEWTRESVLAYAQQQAALNKTIDNALEPSQAANTDLSLNYFLQISNANDRIKAAEAAYQTTAKEAHSPVFTSLPFATSGLAKQSSN